MGAVLRERSTGVKTTSEVAIGVPVASVTSVDSLLAAPLSGTAWHQPAAGGRGRQAQQEDVRHLSDRLLAYRSGRSENGRRQALPLRGHRPDLELRCGRTR